MTKFFTLLKAGMLAALVPMAMLFASCNNANEPTNIAEGVQCDAELEMELSGGNIYVPVMCSVPVTCSTNVDWLTFTPKVAAPDAQGLATFLFTVAPGPQAMAKVYFKTESKGTAMMKLYRGGKPNDSEPGEGENPGGGGENPGGGGENPGGGGEEQIVKHDRFSISESRVVRFSPGNLQATYDGSSWSWAFAPNQWDAIGYTSGNNKINGNGFLSEPGTVDLFGWSTHATCCGINNSQNYLDYSGDFAGWQGAIGGGWRTLSRDEWKYVLKLRPNADNLAAQARVNDISGLVILPDEWVLPSGLNFTGEPYGFATNQYSVEEWSKMEQAGAIFLPCAGKRQGIYVTDLSSKNSVQSGMGRYWSSTPYSTTESASYYVEFSSGYYSDCSTFIARDMGISVRLVQDIE